MEIARDGGNINQSRYNFLHYLFEWYFKVQTGSLVSNTFTYNVPFTGNRWITRVDVTDNNGLYDYFESD